MQTLGEQLAFFLFAVVFSGLLWMPAWLLLSIFTPKALLKNYFKEPHFTPTETILLAQFPGFLFRTVIFAWAVVAPKLGEKRRIGNVKEHMPRWYRVALKILVVHAVFALTIIVTLLPVLLLFDL